MNYVCRVDFKFHLNIDINIDFGGYYEIKKCKGFKRKYSC